MQVARKRSFLNKSVDNYTELKYIESTGIQYIKTKIVPNFNNIKIITSMTDLNNGSYLVLFGCGDYYPRFYLRIASSSSYLEMNQNSSTEVGSGYKISNSISKTSLSEIQITRGNVKIDGTSYSITDYGNLTNVPDNENYKLFLFASNNGGSAFRKTKIRVGKFQVYNEDTLLLDFIPVKDSNNVVCMYDKVSDTFFYNQGTGDFIAGPEI